MHHSHLELDPVSDATLWSAIDAQLASIRHADGNARTPWPRMQVDAVIAAVGAVPGADRVPEITVLTDFATLVDGSHADSICETVDAVPLPVSTVRRLCCDATIVPAVLGSDGELLDLGRGERTAKPRATTGSTGDASHLCSPRLHRGCLGVSDPPRDMVVARPRADRHRQPRATLRTAPSPRPRRRMDADDDPRPSLHLDPTRRHDPPHRQHHRPGTQRSRGSSPGPGCLTGDQPSIRF